MRVQSSQDRFLLICGCWNLGGCEKAGKLATSRNVWLPDCCPGSMELSYASWTWQALAEQMTRLILGKKISLGPGYWGRGIARPGKTGMVLIWSEFALFGWIQVDFPELTRILWVYENISFRPISILTVYNRYWYLHCRKGWCTHIVVVLSQVNGLSGFWQLMLRLGTFGVLV